MDIEALLKLSKPQFVPPLHQSFKPAVIFDRIVCDYINKSGAGVPLAIGIERGDQALSVYRTQCLDEGSACAALNLPYAERLVKTLLWQRGGWRVIVGGPSSVGEHIRRVCSRGGPRTFDVDFMSSVYEHPFTVEITKADKVPAPTENTVRLAKCRKYFPRFHTSSPARYSRRCWLKSKDSIRTSPVH